MSTKVNIPLTITVSATQVTVAVGSSTTVIAVPAAPVVPPVTPPVIPPASGVRWVYRNGVTDPDFDLDVSFAGSANNKDTTGAPMGGTADILFTGSQYNGGWQLMISKCQSNKASCLDTTQYKSLLLSIKPKVSGQQWQVGFMSSGDTPDGPVIDITPYGPVGGSVAGVWGNYVIPLSAFALVDTSVLKFWLQGNTQGQTQWWIDNAGFSP
jgi:hypothetical protein